MLKIDNLTCNISVTKGIISTYFALYFDLILVLCMSNNQPQGSSNSRPVDRLPSNAEKRFCVVEYLINVQVI